MERYCDTCLWFRLEPFKKRAGVCMHSYECGRYTATNVNMPACEHYANGTNSEKLPFGASKTEEMGTEDPDRMCEDISDMYGKFVCSKCGCIIYDTSCVDYGGINYCPDCGRVVEL